MLTDEQFADRLRSRLASEVAHVHADPDLLGALNRRHARRVAFTRASFAIPVAAAVVVTGAVVVAGSGGQRAPAAGASVAASSGVQMRDVAYVTDQIETALAPPYVMRSREVNSDGHVAVEVLDTKTGSSRTDLADQNGPAWSYALYHSDTSGWTDLLVRYRNRVYRRGRMTWPPIGPQAALLDPKQLRAIVASGKLEILGTERLDGHDMLHLRASPRESTPGTPQRVSAQELSELVLLSGPRDIWVDARTYLPYRMTISGRPGNIHDDDHQTVTYEWLPRTAANLAMLDLPIPAGFKPLVSK